MNIERDKNATNARETNRTRDGPGVEGLYSLPKRALRSLRKRLGTNLHPRKDKDRKTKLAKFAAQYGFRLRFYHEGLFAIFGKRAWR